jgi:flagellar biosynthetic protein FliR
LISFDEAQINAWLAPTFWQFLRVLAVFTSAPVFSSRVFTVRARIALAFLVAFAAQPIQSGAASIGFNDPAAFGVVLQQVGIGLALGFAVRLVFAAVELAGEVVGFQMGLNFAAFFDPAMSTQTSAIGRFFGQMAALMFVVMNGHIMVLMAVNKSFEAFPIDQNFMQAMAQMQLYKLGADLFSSALWMALPMIGMLMFANLALGVISRVAPQMNIFAIGFPVTLVVGLVSIAFTLPMLDQPFLSLMGRVIDIFGGS